MTTITVAGVAEIEQAAELGTVRLTVGTDGPDREGVVDEAADIHAAITTEIRTLEQEDGSPVTAWASNGIVVSSSRPWNQDGRQLPLVHSANADISVTFDDAARLSAWLGPISLRDSVTVNAVEWSLTDATTEAVTADVRVKAIKSAVRAAATYAAALALSGLTPVAVADPGLLDPTAPQPGFAATPMSSSLRMKSAAPTTDFAPQPITIAATVHVRFETA
jgi:uncharacterized protein YggE